MYILDIKIMYQHITYFDQGAKEERAYIIIKE